jgi:hypothetical protein
MPGNADGRRPIGVDAGRPATPRIDRPDDPKTTLMVRRGSDGDV